MSPEMDVAMRGSGPGRSESPMRGLVEQADGLGRGAVMKNVVGPVLTGLLRPIYDTELSATEAQSLSMPFSEAGSSQSSFNAFFETALGMLKSRFENKIELDPEDSDAIRELNIDRPELFFFARHQDDRIFYEGIETSIATPLTLGLQIYNLEDAAAPPFYRDHVSSIGFADVDFDKLIEIMERESFDEILFRLTKGPNGFLGGSSSSFSPNKAFFEFADSEAGYVLGYRDSLKIEDAYELVNGKVVGLSKAYHVAAQKKRQGITNGREHRRSSGCPVRHSFEDPDTGEGEEPLIITAKNFLVAALRASQEHQEAA